MTDAQILEILINETVDGTLMWERSGFKTTTTRKGFTIVVDWYYDNFGRLWYRTKIGDLVLEVDSKRLWKKIIADPKIEKNKTEARNSFSNVIHN